MFGSPGRARTDNTTGLSRRPLPVGILGYGAGGGSRTLNIQFLKLAPLPIGIPQRGQGSQNRTDDLLAPNQARYLAALHPDANCCLDAGEGIEPSSVESKSTDLPLAYPAMATLTGLEPTTSTVTRWCSNH